MCRVDVLPPLTSCSVPSPPWTHLTTDSFLGFCQIAAMLTDSLVRLVTECFRRSNVTASQAAPPPLGLGLLQAGDCWRWIECGMALVTQEGAAWHFLYYVAGTLLLLFVYRVAFSPVDMVKVSFKCLCFLDSECHVMLIPKAFCGGGNSNSSSSINTPASHLVTQTPSVLRGHGASSNSRGQDNRGCGASVRLSGLYTTGAVPRCET